jgi:hypothetical protein
LARIKAKAAATIRTMPAAVSVFKKSRLGRRDNEASGYIRIELTISKQAQSAKLLGLKHALLKSGTGRPNSKLEIQGLPCHLGTVAALEFVCPIRSA